MNKNNFNYYQSISARMRWLTAPAAVLLLAACASAPVDLPGGVHHPADVFAEEAPLPTLSSTLSASKPIATPEPVRMMRM